MYIEDIKRFLNKIDLSVAKKIAVEDTLLRSHIWGLDLWESLTPLSSSFPLETKMAYKCHPQ